MKKFTLEIKDWVHVGKTLLRTEESVAEVDFLVSGYIEEIRVYSEYFEAYVPVSEAWLSNNFPAKLATIREAVSVEILNLTMKQRKQFCNDDLTIA